MIVFLRVNFFVVKEGDKVSYCSKTVGAYTMTSSLVHVLLLFAACIAHAHSTASSVEELCVESISSSGTIVYSSTNNTFSHTRDNWVQEIPNDTVVVLFTINAPPGDKGNETKIFLYQVSKGNLIYYLTPKLIDLMTFYAMQLVLRTQHILLDVHTFNTCEGKSWEKLLAEGFPMNKEGSLRSLQADQRCLIWMAALIMVGILSTTIGCGVFIPLLDYITDRATRSQHYTNSSQVLTTMNWLNLGFIFLYFTYTVSCIFFILR